MRMPNSRPCAKKKVFAIFVAEIIVVAMAKVSTEWYVSSVKTQRFGFGSMLLCWIIMVKSLNRWMRFPRAFAQRGVLTPPGESEYIASLQENGGRKWLQLDRVIYAILQKTLY